MEAYKLTVKTAEVHLRTKQIGQKPTQRPSREGKSKMQRKRKGNGEKKKGKKYLQGPTVYYLSEETWILSFQKQLTLWR